MSLQFNGGFILARAILDSVSQASFITSQDCVQKLGCPRVCGTMVVDSIGIAQVVSHGVCNLGVQTLGREATRRRPPLL